MSWESRWDLGVAKIRIEWQDDNNFFSREYTIRAMSVFEAVEILRKKLLEDS